MTLSSSPSPSPSPSPSREEHLVELVDPDGSATGAMTVEEAHHAPGRLHRAFSVFLRDPSGRVLLQQRSAQKTRFPLRWANTCCGHPLPGEELTVAASRRLIEEVGVDGAELTAAGIYSYYAEDPASGRVEYEYDHVLIGDLPAGSSPLPDPAEVADLRWVTVAELQDALRTDPRSYAPWLAGVTACLAAAAPPPPVSPSDDAPSDDAPSDDAPERSGGR